MGINRDIVGYLLDCHRSGVSFERVCTIGRQELHGDPEGILRTVKGGHIPGAEALVAQALAEKPRYAEPFFTALGAKETVSFDNSNYEMAGVIHDFNEPVSDRFNSRFTLVFDGGSLEHIFNFPVAVKNCMKMTAVGGHVISISYINNQPGHGFYQFSPELMYRVFSERNGFGETEVCVLEQGGDGKRWHVKDPESMGRRVHLVNTRPTFLYVKSRKVSETPVFTQWPIQSDYAAIWKDAASGKEKAQKLAKDMNGGIRGLLKSLVPTPLLMNMRNKRDESQRRRRLEMPFEDAAYGADRAQKHESLD